MNFQADVNAKFMRNKDMAAGLRSEDVWKVIFGKDMAAGLRLEDVSGVDYILNGHSSSVIDESQPNFSTYTYNLDDFLTDEQIAKALNHVTIGTKALGE